MIGFIGLILIVVIRNVIIKNDVKSDPVELIAEIISLEKCSKNGRCIFYKYDYNGIEYNGRSRVDLSFSGWCKSRNDCVGLKFKVTVMKSDPEKRYADWDKILEEKEFINISNL